ncbi:GNAT family N-acetyltransferase [Aminobacter aganoensis]|uniref:RimJ/RimL family protein N-acetyltransferase n=1 Tax=Aminobacter aganoensis TaxID=83264 RepID=A0A7X0KNF2_9HYPH|nr:GNAT family N-acetyltransferase [Aminobacter aganoensis]MBB6357088.1 RimJ/RimL family protein N-acetyltransferase [Aminobacter aganoensis]
MNLVLKVLQADDLGAVAHLRLDAAQERFAGGKLGEIFGKLQAARSPAETPIAVVADGAVVGFFILRQPPASPAWAPASAVSLHNLRIGVSFQGRGYARQAMEATVDWIRDHRPLADRLMLAVNELNLPALQLYASCNFFGTGTTLEGPIGRQLVLVRPIVSGADT